MRCHAAIWHGAPRMNFFGGLRVPKRRCKVALGTQPTPRQSSTSAAAQWHHADFWGATDATSDDAGTKSSAHRFRLLRYGPDRGELVGGQRLLGKQQATAFVEVGAPCAQDGSRLLEGLCDDVAHCHVDFALRRLGGF